MSFPFKPTKDLMSVHRLTGGRCLVVGEELTGLSGELDDRGLENAAKRLVRHAEVYEDVRIRRRVQRQAKGDGAASELDKVLDNVVRMKHNHLEGLKTAFDKQPLHPVVLDVHARCFPEGLGAVISVPYEDELIQVRRIAGILRDLPPEVVDALGIRWHFSEIERLLPAYAEALAARRLVTSGDLTHAREQMHASLCALVAYIIAMYFEEAQHETRDRLLAPVIEQQARLSALMRARRAGRSSATPAEESDSIDAIVEEEEAADAEAAEIDAAAEAEAAEVDAAAGEAQGEAQGEDGSSPSDAQQPVRVPVVPSSRG